MILPIVNYGHPVLRQKGVRIEEITPEIRQLVSDMLETMEVASGVGLAAQQVGRALQLTVLDIRGVEDRPSTLEVDGQAVDPASWMPLVLINPRIETEGEEAFGPEGCLSFPEIYADIPRPPSVRVRALGLEGQSITFRAGGLLSRAIQHEYDHLQGILFIDRMTTPTRRELRGALEQIQRETKAALARA